MNSKRVLYPILFLAVSVLFYCAVNPVTGKRELMLYTTADEIALGRQTDAQIIEMYGVYEDAELETYINTMGRDMIPHTHQPTLPYSFKVLDTDVINAFAVPGGYIYFTRGIMAYLNDEAELAGVMGHELGHVNARHSAKTMSKAQLTQLGIGLGAALSETLAQYADVLGMGVQLLFLKFSRDQEREADDLGVEYSMKTGYDATGMATFFETLERMHPSGGGGLPEWFSTHQNPVNRVGAVRSRTAEWKTKLPGKSFAFNKSKYQDAINGLTFGPDPRQGYVEDGIFYHPDMKFQFPVPQGWNVQNTPSQVQIISPQEDAVILFTLAKGANVSAAANEFLQSTQAVEQGRKNVTIGGFTALELTSQISSDQQELKILSNFVLKDGGVLVFHGFTGLDQYDANTGYFSKTAKGFKRLTSQSKINVKPKRIQIKKVTRGGTLRSFLTAQKVKAEDLESVALLNGMQLSDKVKVGDKVKTIK